MSKKAFFEAVREVYRDSLRNHYREAYPLSFADNDQPNTAAVEQALREAGTWLSHAIVAAYDPTDFVDLPPTTQVELQTCVTQLKQFLAAVPLAGEQEKQAWDCFSRILAIVRHDVLEDWRQTIQTLFHQCEEWAAKHEWGTKRYPKTMRDFYLGSYELEQLLIHRRDGRFFLDPVARYVGGANGLIDLYAMPSSDGTRMIKQNGSWYILPLDEQQQPQSWSEATFQETLDGLARNAA